MTISPDSATISGVKMAAGEALGRIRAHPFITAAHAGTLGGGETVRWIMCAGRESRAYPSLISSVLSWASTSALKEVLRSNLDDELGNGDPDRAHFTYYQRLLEQLGMSAQAFSTYEERSGVQLSVNLAYNVGRCGDEGLALGYMIVNESMTPIAYEAAKHSVQRLYPHVPTDFFDAHIQIDEQHVAQLYSALATLPDPDLASIRYGIDLGERGMAVLLDEVHGIYEHFAAS